MNMYEGSEKKCEIIVDSNHLNLRDFSSDFWRKMVEICGASVLSSMHNQDCDAYLLSESSLFVWEGRFLLITCGQTKLIESVLYFLQKVEQRYILQLIFRRKNEYFSELQHSDFDEDVRRLQKKVDGKIAVFGDPKGHFTKRFYWNKERLPATEEQSYELLMYDISPRAAQFLLDPHQSREKLRLFFLPSTLIPRFIIDDFIFTPCGYSLNAIQGNQYLTIHATPQPEHSYVSLETNIPLQEILAHPLAMLQPRAFDIIVHQRERGELSLPITLHDERCYRQEQKLEYGHIVQFYHYETETQGVEQ